MPAAPWRFPRAWHKLRIFAQFHDQITADVRREQDQGVFEIDEPALTVFHHPFVKNLEEYLVHVGMSFFNFIEQHDAIGPAADSLGKHASFAVTDVSGRSTLQGRNRMRLLKLAHVDRDDVLLAAVESFSESECRLGFADATGAGEQKHPDRFVGIIEISRDV